MPLIMLQTWYIAPVESKFMAKITNVTTFEESAIEDAYSICTISSSVFGSCCLGTSTEAITRSSSQPGSKSLKLILIPIYWVEPLKPMLSGSMN